MERTWGPIFTAMVLLAALALAARTWVDEVPVRPRFILGIAAGEGQGVRTRRVEDADIEAQFRAVYAAGGGERECREWLRQNRPELDASFVRIEEDAWLTPISRTLCYGIAAVWAITLAGAVAGWVKTGPAQAHRLAVNVVASTVLGALLVAGGVALNASLCDRYVGPNYLFDSALLGGLLGGAAAGVLLPVGLLQFYVLKNTLKAFAPALAALILMMIVGFCIQLLDSGLDVVRLPRLLAPVMAYSIPMVLPAAFLTAVVITFGRMSANNELTAARGAGIALFQLVRPVLAVALVLCGLAAFLQFETVPRARLRTKALKGAALRTILLDRAKHSARRQLSFGSGFVKCRKLVDGRMQDVLVVIFESQRPVAVLTAARATVAPDPDDDRILVFEMEDMCGRFDRQLSDADAEPAVGRSMTIPLVVHGGSVDPTGEKYLRTTALRKRVNGLRRNVAAQREQFKNPDEAHKAFRKELGDVTADLDAAQDALDEIEQERDRAEADARSLRNQMEDHQHAKVKLDQDAADLGRQLGECMRKLQEKRDQGILEGLEEIAKLEEERDALRARIAAVKEQIAGRKEQIEKARGEWESILEEMARRAPEAAARKEAVERLAGRRDALRDKVRKVGMQRDLRASLLRIHRRLAWALSILGFTLLGVPMGIMAGSRSVMAAFGISFALALIIFYTPLSIGTPLALAGRLPIAPTVWAGNVVTVLLGAALTARASHG